MKKFLLITIAVFAYAFSYAQCTDLFFSEYVEGSSQNKAVEIYNPTNHEISLVGYMIQRWSNGASQPTETMELYQPDSGVTSIQPYDVLVVTNGQIIENDFGVVSQELYDMADLHGTGNHDNSPLYFNGNDCLTLVKSDGTAVDLIGKIGGIGKDDEGWCDIDSLNYIADQNHYWLSWTSDHTLIRKKTVKQGVSQNPDFFNPAFEWDTVPGRFINDTTWSTKDIWDSLGTHTCDCKTTGIKNITKQHQAFFFPNPVINKEFTVKANDIISQVEMVNVIGQIVYKENNNALRGDMLVKLPDCKEGLYLVKIHFKDNRYIVKKILVR